ncbi:MAG: DNA-binding response regulator [Segetibacter sp.]|nr:DNA-binding response regulator [Segetibacter sp.]
MNHLSSIIIDSSNSSLRVLENFLIDSPAVSLDRKFSVLTDAKDYCMQNSADIVICNIDIINKETIDVIKDAQPSSMIVCAGNREAIEQKGLEENIFGYLYKPFSYEKILSMVSKANTHKSFNTYSTYNTTDAKKTFVFIKSEYKTIRVDLEDILYCEGLKDYTQIHLKGKVKPLVTLQNLKSLFEKLPVRDFVRVHRSYIVSIDKIDAISRNEIAIGSSEIPIGDAFRDRLYELIGEHS